MAPRNDLSIHKRISCPECKWNTDVADPPKTAPECPRCGTQTRLSRWKIRYTDPYTKKPRTEMMDVNSKDAAKQALTKRLAEIHDNKYQSKALRVSYEDGRDLFLKHIRDQLKLAQTRGTDDIRPRTVEMYEQKIAVLDKYLGGTYLTDWTPVTMINYAKSRREYISERTGKHLTESSIGKEITVAKIMCSRLSDGSITKNERPILPYNPIRDAKLPKKVKRKFPRPTLEQVWQFIDNATTPELKLFATIGFFSGLRLKNLLLLEWSEVDFEAGVFRIPGRKMKGKRDEELPMLPTVAAALKEWRRSLKVVYPYVITSTGVDREGKVRRGLPITKPQRAWLSTCKATGLVTWEEEERLRRGKPVTVKIAKPLITPHTMKRFFVSMLSSVEPDKEIVRMAAQHSDIKTTELYDEQDISRVREAMAKMEEKVQKRG